MGKVSAVQCKFCGAVAVPGWDNPDRGADCVIWFECGTMYRAALPNRKDQTLVCSTLERERLESRIAELQAQIDGLKDPQTVRGNILRGTIILPPSYGDLQPLRERIKRLEEALGLIQPTCECVHHSTEHHHDWSEPCPVVEVICRVREAKL